MAKFPSKGTRIWLNQYSVSGFLNAADLDVKQAVPATTSFEDAGPRRIVDNYDHSHSYGGLFDAGANTLGASNPDAVLDALRESAGDHYLAELFAGTTEGNPCYESIIRLSGKPISARSGQAIMLNFDADGADGLARSLILRYATITGTGNSTGRNVGATTAGQRTVAVMRVFAMTGNGFDWKVQESSDDAGSDAYADITGLAGSVAAVGAVRDEVVIATEAWKRLVILNWDATSALIGFTVGKVFGS